MSTTSSCLEACFCHKHINMLNQIALWFTFHRALKHPVVKKQHCSHTDLCFVHLDCEMTVFWAAKCCIMLRSEFKICLSVKMVTASKSHKFLLCGRETWQSTCRSPIRHHLQFTMWVMSQKRKCLPLTTTTADKPSWEVNKKNQTC